MTILCRKCQRSKHHCTFQPRDVKLAIESAMKRGDQKYVATCRMCRQEASAAFRVPLHGRRNDSRSSLAAIFGRSI